MVIAAAWLYGASKVATAPPATSMPNPTTVDGHGTGVVSPPTIKVGDIVVGDFANAIDVNFRVMQVTSTTPGDIVVSRVGDPANTPIDMPIDSIKRVIPS